MPRDRRVRRRSRDVPGDCRGFRHDASRTRGARPSAQVLEVLARLEPDGPARRNADLLAGPWVTADAPLAGLHLEDAEPAQFDAIAPLHRQAHGVEHGVDGQLGLHLRDVGGPGHFVDDVDLDHAGGAPSRQKLLTIIGRET
ncbi:MAG: hypothetical protein MZV64_73135 [Ignavibacteriales bacterium]|nr:hypothetical protein [Ignavibacteriales bacterium]